jgi:hypothetical protein
VSCSGGRAKPRPPSSAARNSGSQVPPLQFNVQRNPKTVKAATTSNMLARARGPDLFDVVVRPAIATVVLDDETPPRPASPSLQTSLRSRVVTTPSEHSPTSGRGHAENLVSRCTGAKPFLGRGRGPGPGGKAIKPLGRRRGPRNGASERRTRPENCFRRRLRPPTTDGSVGACEEQTTIRNKGQCSTGS